MSYTPMIQQYLSIKNEYLDAFVFFRLGDFYELFFDDALKASKELEITLTSRDGGSKDRIPMCGVPYHSARGYITRLIEKGYKVAICEQVEDPKVAKGVVKREVIQLITPGTIMDGGFIEPKENNYLAALAIDGETYGLAFIDLTTGEGRVTQMTEAERVIPELLAFSVKELVTPEPERMEKGLHSQFQESGFLTLSALPHEDVPTDCEALVTQPLKDVERKAFGRLVSYLMQTQRRALDHLQPVESYEIHHYMRLNRQTRRNLELTSSIREKKKQGSLLWLLDQTMTAMGGRKLKNWIEKPLIDRTAIQERLEAVDALRQAFFERENLREALQKVYDLERLVGRIAFGNVNARELIQLKISLSQIPIIKGILREMDYPPLNELANQLDACVEVYERIEQGILEDPPISVTEGGIIKDGYHDQLDQYREVSRNGKAWLADLEKKEREATGIKSLKIGYNKVFGYYIEITRANLKALPEGRYERKQTLTNAERFITPELKEKERLIMEAEDHKMDLEYTLFQEIREAIKQHAGRLQKLAGHLSSLDVLQSFASVSESYHYNKPTFTDERSIRLIGSRHPVVEKVLKEGEFVSNDVHLPNNCLIQLITGPNMGGKSTYMRQIALSAIMAQIGCFVPAEEAVLPIFDQIFTRIGATDDLSSGQSTFMVEMVEAKEALAQATSESLILLDEIGRGTSTYDGIAIAQAIVEYIHNHVKAKTLFSTHYHELTALSDALDHLVNVHVSAMEQDGHVVFLHKVKEGHADKSYGIHVAELAELPNSLIQRATAILADLEKSPASLSTQKTEPMAATPDDDNKGFDVEPETPTSVAERSGQLSLFEEPDKRVMRQAADESVWEKRLREIDLLNMTPMEAMNVLYECQMAIKQVKRGKQLVKR